MAPRADLFAANARAVARLEDMPPHVREDPDVQAVVYCQSKEDDRLEDMIEQMRMEGSPLHASTVGIEWWEVLLKLPADPALTIEQRQDRATDRMRALSGDPSGRSFIARLTQRLGQGWTYEENVPGDATTPPAQTLRFHLPWPDGTMFQYAQRVIQEEAPAELDLVFISSAGFVLDESQWDQDTFAI